MIRVLVSPDSLVEGAVIALDEDEAHHLKVRRVDSGEAAFAIDGAGKTATGEVRGAKKHWSFRVESIAEFPPSPTTILAVAAGDRDRFHHLVEKATELGITHIIPLETEHSKKVANKLRGATITKLRRVTLEACKQSGNPWAITIESPVGLSVFLHNLPRATWFLADLNGEVASTMASSESIGWLIGPEGGFSDSELIMLRDQVKPRLATLGKHMLRFETAALAAAAVTADRRAHG